MTDPLDKQYEPHDVEAFASSHWDETNAYEYTKETRSDGETLYFLDGPPFTSGQMHLGTAWNKILKDVLVRYKRMDGYNVLDRPGYDMHGLPIETKVEEELGFQNKQDIEEFGADEFVERCRDFALENRAKMDEDFQSVGVWMDWDNTYQTLDSSYMETVWWAFNQSYENGLVERGERVVNVCPRCETALADAELDYHTVTSNAAYVLFPLTDEDGWLVTWTTTPWTVPANQFVAVDEDETYARVEAEDDAFYMAEACVDDVMEAGGYEFYTVVDTMQGEELVGRQYRHPLASSLPDHPRQLGTVEHADYVELDMTGMVHSAPGHGFEDYERGEELGLDAFSPVGQDGKFTEYAGPYEGLYVHDATDAVLDDLREAGALLAEHDHEHSYGQCPRCDTDIVFRAASHWVVDLEAVKDDLIDNIEKTNWAPSGARDNRFRNFVESSREWTLSRQRYWGTPIPIWVCGDCGHERVVGSVDELVAASSLDEAPDDLHRPTVDSVTVECDCGGDMNRVDDVFDVWFDSAAASWASLDFPANHDDVPSDWPADLIVEAHDQTRGWFWSQLCLGTAAVGDVPYRDVLMHGFATLEGDKMSKSRGNVLTPETAIERVGRDPLRAYLLSSNPQGVDLNVEWDGLETMRNDLNVVWNVFRFASQYMGLDDYTPTPTYTEAGEPTATDRWVLSRLHTVVKEMTASLEEYRTDEALETLLSFLTNDLSRYYVKTVRDRVWVDDLTDDKLAAYDALSTVLFTASKLLAPYTPYLAERLYQGLDGDETTVHATDWPTSNEKRRDSSLEARMEAVRNLESSVSNARQNAGVKHRWPLQRVEVVPTDPTVRQAVEEHEALLKDRLNVKEVAVVSDPPTVQKARPVIGVLGPELRGEANAVAQELDGTPRDEYNGVVTVDGEEYDIPEDGVEFERVTQRETVFEATFNGGSAYVDTEVTSTLRSEGLARDLVRRVQEMRQSLDLALDDMVAVSVYTDEESLQTALYEHRQYVKNETRATTLTVNNGKPENDDGRTETWHIEGMEVTLSVARRE